MSDAKPVLEAERLSRHYTVARGWFQPPATVRALEEVSFALHPRQTLAVVGESGCGKSTLARQLTLIETPTDGALRLLGRDLAQAGERERRAARRHPPPAAAAWAWAPRPRTGRNTRRQRGLRHSSTTCRSIRFS